MVLDEVGNPKDSACDSSTVSWDAYLANAQDKVLYASGVCGEGYLNPLKVEKGKSVFNLKCDVKTSNWPAATYALRVKWCGTPGEEFKYVVYESLSSTTAVDIVAHVEPKTLWRDGVGTRGAIVVLDKITNNDPKCGGEYPIKIEIKARGASDYKDYTSECSGQPGKWISPARVSIAGIAGYRCEGREMPDYYEGPHVLRVSWCSGSVETQYGVEPKLKMLFVPLNEWGSQEEFDLTAKAHVSSLVNAIPLASCPNRLEVVTMKVPDEIFKDAKCHEAGGIKPFAESRGYRTSDYDAIIGIVKVSFCGQKITAESNQAERTMWVMKGLPGTTNHEMGHLLGLQEEYCSNPAGSSSDRCNNAVSEPNNLDPALECDPSAGASCCTFRATCNNDLKGFDKKSKLCWSDDSTLLAKEGETIVKTCGPKDGSEYGKIELNYGICCLGNKILSTKNGRCYMSYNDAPGPRDFCDNCKKYFASIPSLQC